MPENSQTLKDYGFSHIMTDPRKPTMLLGLYIGLLDPRYLGVKATTLHRWRLSGTLVENIKKEFERLPPAARGAYYTWFLENEGVVSGAGAEERERQIIEESIRRAWTFIGKSPTAPMREIMRYLNSISKEKADCFNFYTQLLSGSHPAPNLGQWIHAAFCACDSQEAEMGLAQSYIALIHLCTFEEFCTAYTSSSLISLFKDKDLAISDPFVIDVLSGSPNSSKSVWYLKQYIEVKVIHGQESDTTRLPTPSVAVDYGFLNCTSVEEHRMLVDLYKGFFALEEKANPLELHASCIQGRLFAYFVEDLMFKLKPKKVYKRMLKNPYPLPDE